MTGWARHRILYSGLKMAHKPKRDECMDNETAQRILNEHRAENPIFIRGSRRYVVRNNGTVEVWLAVGKSGQRWRSYQTYGPEDYFLLPSEVRIRAKEQL